MGLGELPARSTMRMYYKMENANDSSLNAFTLTNTGSVPFNAGKFNKAADNGTSTTKGLSRNSTNVFSVDRVTNATVSMWVKLNAEVSGVLVYTFLVINSKPSSTAGTSFRLNYSIISTVKTIQATITFATTNAFINYGITLGTSNWFNLIMVKTGTTLDLYINGSKVGTSTGSGLETCLSTTVNLALNNNGGFNSGVEGLMDEVIIEERAWSQSEIAKYYSQAKGFLPPQ